MGNSPTSVPTQEPVLLSNFVAAGELARELTSGASSYAPTYTPSAVPNQSPPTSIPTLEPIPAPTVAPYPGPTVAPYPGPTVAPSYLPTVAPYPGPTVAPSYLPTAAPSSSAPSRLPTPAPTSFDNGIVATVHSEMVVQTSGLTMTKPQKEAFKEAVASSMNLVSSGDDVSIVRVVQSRRRMSSAIEPQTGGESTVEYNFTVAQAGNYNATLLLQEVEGQLEAVVNESASTGGFNELFEAAAESLNSTAFPVDIEATEVFLEEETYISAYTIVTRPPTMVPTPAPSSVPIPAPTSVPTPKPSSIPTIVPSTSPMPTATPMPTGEPTFVPTSSPTISQAPTMAPSTAWPSPAPSMQPFPAPSSPAPSSMPVADRRNKKSNTQDPGATAIGLFVGLAVFVVCAGAVTIYFGGQPDRQAAFQRGISDFLNKYGMTSQDSRTPTLQDRDLEAVAGQTELGNTGMRQHHL